MTGAGKGGGFSTTPAGAKEVDRKTGAEKGRFRKKIVVFFNNIRNDLDSYTEPLYSMCHAVSCLFL
jgi:hypothetical protein